MPFQQTLQTTTFINTDLDTSAREFVIVSNDECLVVPQYLLLNSILELTSATGVNEIDFTQQVLIDVIDNYGDYTMLNVSIVELPDNGALYLNGILIEESTSISWADIPDLKFVAQGWGNSYANVKITFTPVPDPVSVQSEILTVIFNMISENTEPTVSPASVTIPYMTQHIVTLGNVTFEYQDEENNPFSHITVDSISGDGELLFDGVVQNSFPITVTKQELLDEKLVYNDPGSIIESKQFIINFTPYDDV